MAITTAVSRYTPGGIYSNINSPFWAAPTNLSVGQIANSQYSDFYPEDGWELLKVNFGRHVNDSIRSILPNMPYMALYNKYTGTMRFLGIWPNVSNSWQIIRFKLTLLGNKYTYDGNDGDELNATNLLSIQGEAAQPLDQETEENVYEIIAEFPGISNAGYFFWFDLPVAYDPCVCKNESAILLEASVENNWNITLKGLLDARVIQKGSTASGNNYSTLLTKRIVAAATATFGAVVTQGAVVDVGAYTDLVQIFSNRPGIDNKTKSGLTLLHDLLSSAGGIAYDSNKLQWRNTVTGDSLTKSDWNKLFSGMGSFLNSGVDFLSPTAKAGQPRSSVVGTMTATGTASLNIPSGDIVYWGVPGSALSNSLADTVTPTPNGMLPEYPIYDYPLGTFALLNTPKLYVKTLDPVPIFSGAWYTDPNGVTQCDMPYNDRIQMFFADQPIYYRFNPALNIDYELTSIQASIVVKEQIGGLFHKKPLGNPAFGSYCGNDIALYEQEMDWYNGVNLYIGVDSSERISPPVPIDDLGEVAATFLADGESYLHASYYKYFIRFYLDVVSKNLDKNGNRVKNKQVITFPVERIDFPYNSPLPFAEIDIQNNLDPNEYSEPTMLPNGQNNYNPDYIHISSLVNSPYPLTASITSGSVIHLTPGAHIEPNIRLNIGNPFQGLYPHPEVTSNYVSSFCNNQISGLTYQANQFSAKAKKYSKLSRVLFEEEFRNSEDAQIIIHPNPANSQIRITSSSKPITEIEIFDLSGRSLIHQKTDGAGLSRVAVNVTSLQSGVYVVQAVCGDERNTQKLVISR